MLQGQSWSLNSSKDFFLFREPNRMRRTDSASSSSVIARYSRKVFRTPIESRKRWNEANSFHSIFSGNSNASYIARCTISFRNSSANRSTAALRSRFRAKAAQTRRTGKVRQSGRFEPGHHAIQHCDEIHVAVCLGITTCCDRRGKLV